MTGMDTSFAIAGRPIGPGEPPYVVAELSGNHNGELGRALALIDAAKRAGADAVKLQTYTADTITLDADGPEFRVEGGLWNGRTLHDLYREAHTPWDWHEALFARGREIGITVFSAPFDPTAVELLERLNAPAYKIASFEIVDLPLIERTARTGKPLIISTGMATRAEIGEAVDTVRAAGAAAPLLLYCVSGYPTPAGDANLRSIPDLARAFGAPVGLSDHTLGIGASIAAVALGAVLIEKHVTLRRADGGPDAAFSLEPDELAQLVTSVRDAWASLGEVKRDIAASERGNLKFRRSLYVVRDVRAGERMTADHVRSIRPAYGLAPKHLPEVIGRHAKVDLKRGTALRWDHLV
jgi:N-acetylneuraminate synthase